MFPYCTYPTSSDSDYLRALAEEHAAREQYAAARRAQEEARARAARAQAARRAYASPYSSFLDGDYLASPYNEQGMEIISPDDRFGAYHLGPSPRARSLAYEDPHSVGYGANLYAQRALMEERRRRELLELEREKERRRLEEERIRKFLREEREREEAARQKLLEEERMRMAVEEERLRQTLREEEEARERERAQQTSVDPIDILRALGLAPTASVYEQERFGRPTGTRTSPSGIHRTTPSPIRPFPFGRTSTGQHPRTPSPVTKTPAPQPTTPTIPISSPKSTPTRPTPEQLAAAEQILAAYRAHISRKAALASISSIRKRFLAARSGFTLPTTLDYDVASNGRAPPTTVALGSGVDVADLAQDNVLERTPRLAYSATNAPLHAYEEELNRILGALDAVESNGDLGVRAARRELARAVEREAEKVERWRGVVWRWWVENQKAASATAPEATETPVAAPTSETEDAPVVSPSEAGETCMRADIPQEGTMRIEASMEVEPAPASDSSALSTDSDDATEPPVAIAIASPTPPESIEVVDPTPAAQVSTESPHDSDASLQPEAPSVDRVSSGSTPDVASDESARPATPALSEGPSEPEEMEVESREVHTPPRGSHAPVVAVDAESLSESLRLEQKEQVPSAATHAPREEAS
ncbi:hypothetical protein LXA43DRAFT_1183090 [Ganoderma leucocontextum]|nr:hypothetical protein LXA43DRAFT_1183090 [Ganoderma leucocontextum]